MNELKAIVIILGPITLWFLLTCLMLGYLLCRLWRCVRKKPGAEWNSRRIAFTVIAFVWVAASFWYGGGVKIYYDAKVNRLCAKDGGVKVYETVTLPPEMFNEWGNIDVPSKKNAKPSDEYFYEDVTTYIRKEAPSLRRSHAFIVRRSDGKVLGEAVSYHRIGGDYLPIPGHPSSFACPKLSELNYEQAIFVKEAVK